MISADHNSLLIADESYSYDEAGTRTASTGSGQADTYTTSADNRLDSNGTYTYEYDAEGNRTAKVLTTIGPLTLGTLAQTEYIYDHRNRLSEVVFENAIGQAIKRVRYTYDPLNNRIATEIDALADGTYEQVERFILDGEHVALVFNESAQLTHRYLHGPTTDQVLAEEMVVGLTSTMHWLLSDHQGSVRDVVNADGVKLDHIVYDSFGRIAQRTNAAMSLRFGYTGRELAGEAGVTYCGNMKQQKTLAILGIVAFIVVIVAAKVIYDWQNSLAIYLAPPEPHGLEGPASSHFQTTLPVTYVYLAIDGGSDRAATTAAIGGATRSVQIQPGSFAFQGLFELMSKTPLTSAESLDPRVYLDPDLRHSVYEAKLDATHSALIQETDQGRTTMYVGRDGIVIIERADGTRLQALMVGEDYILQTFLFDALIMLRSNRTE